MKINNRYISMTGRISAVQDHRAVERPAPQLETEPDTPELSELWRFVADCGATAERVFLVKDCDGQASVWIEMERDDQGRWTVTDRLTPGRYRVRCISGEGESYYNCGTAGLSGNRLTDRAPGVFLETLPM